VPFVSQASRGPLNGRTECLLHLPNGRDRVQRVASQFIPAMPLVSHSCLAEEEGGTLGTKFTSSKPFSEQYRFAPATRGSVDRMQMMQKCRTTRDQEESLVLTTHV
jgi:hypothetical protein